MRQRINFIRKLPFAFVGTSLGALLSPLISGALQINNSFDQEALIRDITQPFTNTAFADISSCGASCDSDGPGCTGGPGSACNGSPGCGFGSDTCSDPGGNCSGCSGCNCSDCSGGGSAGAGSCDAGSCSCAGDSACGGDCSCY